jgi:hypothetical protein
MKPPDRLAEEVKKEQGRIDDYLGSVRGLHAFAESACFDDAARQRVDGSRYCIPRSMNTVAPGPTLTPDGVVQPRPDYGIITEMKKHYPDGVDEYIDQVKKYDQDLIGWWTKGECLTPHDLVLLTHMFSLTNATDAYENWKTAGNQFTRPFAIVEYGYVESLPQRYFMLRRMAGALSDKKHDEALRQGKMLPDGLIVELFARCKLYDAKPPLIHMVVLLYMETMNLFVPREEFEATGRLRKTVTVTVAEVREKMEEQFCRHTEGARQPRLPKKEWVQEALEALQDMELAKREGKERYHVLIARPGRKDALAWLVAKWLRAQDWKAGKKQVDAAQGDLFANQQATRKKRE